MAVAHPEEDSRIREGEDDWRNYIMSAVDEGLGNGVQRGPMGACNKASSTSKRNFLAILHYSPL